MLIASVPGDEASVAAAVSAHPDRFVGAFMFDPAAPDADARLERAFVELNLSTVCLFPAMHHVPVDDERTARVFQAAERHGKVVFALRRAVGWRPQEAESGEPVRSAPWRSARRGDVAVDIRA
jgi:predicted TIM-barrel fold metal-dependent hydrolase